MGNISKWFSLRLTFAVVAVVVIVVVVICLERIFSIGNAPLALLSIANLLPIKDIWKAFHHKSYQSISL